MEGVARDIMIASKHASIHGDGHTGGLPAAEQIMATLLASSQPAQFSMRSSLARNLMIEIPEAEKLQRKESVGASMPPVTQHSITQLKQAELQSAAAGEPSRVDEDPLLGLGSPTTSRTSNRLLTATSASQRLKLERDICPSPDFLQLGLNRTHSEHGGAVHAGASKQEDVTFGEAPRLNQTLRMRDSGAETSRHGLQYRTVSADLGRALRGLDGMGMVERGDAYMDLAVATPRNGLEFGLPCEGEKSAKSHESSGENSNVDTCPDSVQRPECLGIVKTRSLPGRSARPRTVAERKRRNNISLRLDQLKAALPLCNPRITTETLLCETLSYIDALKGKVRTLQAEKANLLEHVLGMS